METIRSRLCFFALLLVDVMRYVVTPIIASYFDYKSSKHIRVKWQGKTRGDEKPWVLTIDYKS